MKKRFLIYVCLLVLGLEFIGFFHAQAIAYFSVLPPTPIPRDVSTSQAPLFLKTILVVPYINEAPENIWSGPWKNACEEATIAMVEKYYQGIDTVSISESKELMQTLFEEQNKRWGTNANSEGARMIELIETHGSFHARLVEDPQVDDIKDEIVAGRPVITLHRGFDLQNENIPFLPTGSAYHTLVIIGFDEESGQFITNDPGDTLEGAGRVYTYDVIMESLHDYNTTTHLADGPPRVIFTAPLL